jgi:hypothetical protein
MDHEKAVRFVGLYGSFRISKSDRHAHILEDFLGIEDFVFKKMKYGKTSDKLRNVSFTTERLQGALRSISTGDADFLQLIPHEEDESWVESLKTSVQVNWASSLVIPKHRPLSPVEERSSFAGTIDVACPLSWFNVDSESAFQQKLMGFMKRSFLEEDISWCFVHLGYRLIHPFSVGIDDIFAETRNRFPLTSFDYDLLGGARYYTEFVKGAFWANFLNPLHVKNLGGLKQIQEERPCSVIEELGSGRALLQVGPSPITADELRAAEDYQRLRRFLKPILLETHDEEASLHRRVIGSWTTSEVSEKEWRKISSHKPEPRT